MAPSRRKAARKAAAARQQWKVGDLVLAKVKGFPAWPATVSEPEKWGYSSDWRKVPVYFFGTQQIAFCNPADVEAFTDETKESLLSKRRGKGADFLRAVQEIIDSYENLKKKDRGNDINSDDEFTAKSGGNSSELPPQNDFKDRTKNPESSMALRVEMTNSALDRNESIQPVLDAMVDGLDDKEITTEKPADSVIDKKMPLIATYSSRKRSSSLRVKGYLAQTIPALVKNTSSRSQSCGLGNLANASFNCGKDSSILSPNVSARNSSDAFECVEMRLFSNGSIEDNGSEIATVESDSFSVNEGSTMDSHCKVEQSGSVECLGGDVELNKMLDLQLKAAIVKKKRKPNRKRVNNDPVDFAVKFDDVAGLGIKSQDIELPPNSSEKINEPYSKEYGDGHLPLSKRARVRMEKSFTEERLHGSMQMEEKPLEENKVTSLMQKSSPSDCDDIRPADGYFAVAERALDNASKSCPKFMEKKAQSWQVTSTQSIGCSLDSESALPPSKRIHRALEAMSANAAEEDHLHAEVSPRLKTSIDNCCDRSLCQNLDWAVKTEEGNGLIMKPEISPGNKSSDFGITGFSLSSSQIVSDETAKSSVGLDTGNHIVNSLCDQKNEAHLDIPQEAMDNVICKDQIKTSVICKDQIQTSSDNHTLLVTAHSPGSTFSTFGRGGSNCFNRGLLEELPSRAEGNPESNFPSNSGSEDAVKEHSESEHSGMKSGHVSIEDKCELGLPQSGTVTSCHEAGATTCENTDSLKSHVDENSQINGISDVGEENKDDEGQKVKSSMNPSIGYFNDIDVSGGRSTSSPITAMDSPPANTSVCHMSTSESVAEEGKAELVVTQKPKCSGKLSRHAEAHAALSYFEAMLGTLTRTKESIGRATRIAIDCAKFGISSKVIEILIRTLESEPSLHKRVDLFFLVDSIAQCSRGLKGDVGGIYPSAIQVVLPRLLSATAPLGGIAQENRRQCLKVLRLWLERRILPESVICHHMRELDSQSASLSTGLYCRRSSRTERALDDPVREMEGMLVDEYGSNSSFQLPGLCMPPMLKDVDADSDSDGGSFEAVTPERNCETPEAREKTPITEKRRYILEDVDGELEMEDAAPSPSCEVEHNTITNAAQINCALMSHDQLQHLPCPTLPPPLELASFPPLPSSPQPVPPPPPPLPSSLGPASAVPDHYADAVGSKLSHPSLGRLGQSVAEPAAPRSDPSFSDSGHFYAPQYRDPLIRPQELESFSGPFSIHARGNNAQTGSSFRSKAQPPRLPHVVPSNQFSYVQADQHVKSRREVQPHCYPNRFHYGRMECGNYYNNHERLKPGPYDYRGGWRCPPPPFLGARYPGRKANYAHAPYMEHEQTRLLDQGWDLPPHAFNHRNSMPFRPPSESSITPGFWRPR